MRKIFHIEAKVTRWEPKVRVKKYNFVVKSLNATQALFAASQRLAHLTSLTNEKKVTVETFILLDTDESGRCTANTQLGSRCTRSVHKQRLCRRHYDFKYHLIAKQGPTSNAGAGWKVDPYHENRDDGREDK